MHAVKQFAVPYCGTAMSRGEIKFTPSLFPPARESGRSPRVAECSRARDSIGRRRSRRDIVTVALSAILRRRAGVGTHLTATGSGKDCAGRCGGRTRIWKVRPRTHAAYAWSAFHAAVFDHLDELMASNSVAWYLLILCLRGGTDDGHHSLHLRRVPLLRLRFHYHP
jgi:hypothetical protein